MSRRHQPTDATDAAIERQLSSLRQIPAKIEAAEFMAKKFSEAGRPLSDEHFWEDEAMDERPLPIRPMPPEMKIEPYPREVRIAFFRGAAVTAAIAALLWLVGVL